MRISVKCLLRLTILTILRVHSAKGSDVFHLNVTALSGILQRVNCLNVQLRNESDMNNTVLTYLLGQTHCALQLSVSESIAPANSDCRHRARTLYSNELSTALAVSQLSRGQILLLVLLDEPAQDELHALALLAWQQRGIYEVYYFSATRSVFFNPFALNDRTEAKQQQFGQFVSIEYANPSFVFNNMNGYALRVYIFDSVYSEARLDGANQHVESVHGADAKVAKLLAQRFNLTLQLQIPDEQFFGARLSNGSFDGALGRLLRYETDAVLTGFFVKDYLTRDVEFSVAVYTDELCCYVRKAKRVPQSILPLFAVHLDVWSSFFAVGFGCPLIWLLIRYANQRLQISNLGLQPLRIFIDTWVVWVRVNIGVFPPSHAERIFVISLCLVSVIFGALFESSLATVYIRPLYYPDINTLSELDRAKYRIYIKHAAMKDDLFFGHTSPVYQNLDERVVLVAELEDRLINMMSKLGGFAAVTRASSLLLDDIYYVITKRIHMIPECPKHYHIAYVFPKHSPFEEYFNAFLLDCLQAGLIDWWVEQMKHAAKISMHRFSNNADEATDKWKVFTLKDLQLAFYALFLGSTLAIIIFVIEVLLHSHTMHTLMKKLRFKITTQL